MATPAHDVLAEIGIRINGIAGSQSSTLETNWAIRPLTTTQWKSAVFTFASAQAAQLRAEQRLAHAIANSNNTWRSTLAAQTSALTTGVALPTAISSAQVIGLWGNVYDGSDSTPMTENSLKEIRRANSNSNTWRKSSVYWYKIIGSRIHHTRTSAILDCCTYNGATQKTAIANNSNMLLPDVLAPAIICGALALLLRDSQFAEQAGQFANLFAAQEEAIRQGSVNDVTHIPMAAAA